MSKLMAFSPVTEETHEVGDPSESLTRLVELGEFMAARPDLIVYLEGPVTKKLPKWGTPDAQE